MPQGPAAASEEALKRYGIGLTGGIGTGKSTVARLLMQRGFSVIDADQLARAVTAPGSTGLQAVAKRFGAEVLAADGSLDRKALGRVVFADPELRQALEAITHPLIGLALAEQVTALQLAQQPRWFFYEAALIFERGLDSRFAQVWATYCSPQRQLERVMARDGLGAADAAKVLASQLDSRTKAARATLVIATDGSLADTAAALQEALARLPPLWLAKPGGKGRSSC